MTGLLFADTNILVYSVDQTNPVKHNKSVDLLKAATASRTLVLSPQSLNEAWRVLTEKQRHLPRAAVRIYLAGLIPHCTAPLNAETTQKAWAVQDETGFQWWDCLLLASALQAGAKIFASEDMQAGRVISGMQIINPFTANLAQRARKT